MNWYTYFWASSYSSFSTSSLVGAATGRLRVRVSKLGVLGTVMAWGGERDLPRLSAEGSPIIPTAYNVKYRPVIMYLVLLKKTLT